MIYTALFKMMRDWPNLWKRFSIKSYGLKSRKRLEPTLTKEMNLVEDLGTVLGIGHLRVGWEALDCQYPSSGKALFQLHFGKVTNALRWAFWLP